MRTESSCRKRIGRGFRNGMGDQFLCKKLYEKPLFFDLRGLQALLSERMEELDIRKKIAEAVKSAGFLPYLNAECEKKGTENADGTAERNG